MEFKGFVQLESSLVGAFVTRNGAVPTNSASLPVFRVYGPGGLMNNGVGTAAFLDSAPVTGATNVSPIVVQSVSHGLETGSIVTISGVLGNTAANGTFTITKVSSSTFSLNGSTGNGAYTSGGTWNVAGLYKVTVSCVAADGYLAGETYTVVMQATVGASAWADSFTFVVT